MLSHILFALVFSNFVRAEGCPGADDEPALSVKTKAGPTLTLCGFEDHEIKAQKGRRAFSEFTVFATAKESADPQRVYSSEGGDTHWARALPGGALELEELWFFADKPHPAIARTFTCDAQGCQASATKCVLTLKKNVFPKSLATLEKRLKKKENVGEDGEDLLDEVWAQALTGDPKALAFYEAEPPAGLDSTLTEVFAGNRVKLNQAKELHCIPAKRP